MNQTESDNSSIDLALAFFCAVFVLFVFVKLNVQTNPEQPTLASIGNPVSINDAIPNSWQTIAQRGGFAIHYKNKLLLLNMSNVARGIHTDTYNSFGQNGWLNWDTPRGSSAAPHAYILEIWINVTNPPAPWIRQTVDFSEVTECNFPMPALVTVFIEPSSTGLDQLAEFARICGSRLRFQLLRREIASNGITLVSIGLSPSAYSRRNIFR